jgi:hypothetical protein
VKSYIKKQKVKVLAALLVESNHRIHIHHTGLKPALNIRFPLKNLFTEPLWPDNHELIEPAFRQCLPLPHSASGHAQQPCQLGL